MVSENRSINVRMLVKLGKTNLFSRAPTWTINFTHSAIGRRLPGAGQVAVFQRADALWRRVDYDHDQDQLQPLLRPAAAAQHRLHRAAGVRLLNREGLRVLFDPRRVGSPLCSLRG